MSTAVAARRISASGMAFSLVLVCLAGGLVFQSVRLLGYDRVSAAASALLAGEYWKRPLYTQLAPTRAQVAQWRDEPGARRSARTLYTRLGQASGVPVAETMAAAADVLRIDPVSGQAWADFATSALAASRPDLALAAWDISAVVAPREDTAILWRLSFLAGLWDMASEEQKQRFFFDIQILSTRGAATRFPQVWLRILASLPPALARELDARRWRLPRPAE